MTQYNLTEIFKRSDDLYSARLSLNTVNALRVEQGEYVIAPSKYALGTYNVQQCVVLYVRTHDNKKHGLAHIDGHTEINSVNAFITSFNSDNAQPLNVTMLGGYKDSMESGFNIPSNNINKVMHFLKLHNLSYNIITEKFHDFIFDQNGHLIKGISKGEYNECRALHILQAVKRKNIYMGAYPIIPGCTIEPNDEVYLDQRSTNFLRNFDIDTFSSSGFGSLPPVTDEEFIESVTKLREYRLNAVNEFLKRNTYYNLSLFEEIPISITYLNQTHHSNDRLINISPSLWLEDSYIMNKENSRATIGTAIDLAKRYDKKLDSDCIVNILATSYKISKKSVLLQQFDAQVSAKQFFENFKLCGSFLYSSIIHFSNQYNAFEPSEVTIKLALDNALNISNTVTTSDIIYAAQESHNKHYMSLIQNIDFRNAYKEISLAITRLELNPGRKINAFIGICISASKNLLDWKNCIKNYKQSADWFTREIEEKVEQELLLIEEENLRAHIYNNDTQYYDIKNTVVNFLAIKAQENNRIAFDEYSLGNLMAFDQYQVQIPNIKYELLQKFCSENNVLSDSIDSLCKIINSPIIDIMDVPSEISEDLVHSNQEQPAEATNIIKDEKISLSSQLLDAGACSIQLFTLASMFYLGYQRYQLSGPIINPITNDEVTSMRHAVVKANVADKATVLQHFIGATVVESITFAMKPDACPNTFFTVVDLIGNTLDLDSVDL
jgi:hypothetical protein